MALFLESPLGIGIVALRIFAAFAGVALAADAVHGDGQRFVRFLADRAVGHRAGLEALHDALDRFDFLDRNRLRVFLKSSKPRSVHQVPRLLVDQRGVFLEQSCNCPCGQAFCSLWIVCGLNRWYSPSSRH